MTFIRMAGNTCQGGLGCAVPYALADDLIAAPATFLGGRLRHSSGGDDVTVTVYSKPRKQMYSFVLLKDARGVYRIHSASATEPDFRDMEQEQCAGDGAD